MEFGVLGPLLVRGSQGVVDVVGGKERLLLAHLVSAAGRMVSVDELSDSLWGERPPRAPGKAMQTYVLRLRNALEPERRGVPTVVLTEGTGYRLAVGAHEVDAARFARLADAGRAALDDGRPSDAAVALREADQLWRGPAYAGFEETPFGRSEGQRLSDLRVSATENLWAAEVDLGHAASAIPELERLVSENAWRERAWATLVLAYFRAGRQGDALGALDRARSRLADDLGVDPGPELRDLQARVLAHDEELLRLPVNPTVTATSPPVDAREVARVRAEATAVVRQETDAVASAGDRARGGRAALAEGILVLQSGAQPGSLPSEVCPWRGLAAYDVEDHPWYAGRERLVAELLARVSTDRLVVVVGASGSGKSSLVRAGLVGTLACGGLPGSGAWSTIVMRPGASPMRELAERALGAAHVTSTLGDLLLRMASEGTDGTEGEGDQRVVLVVDQLEEVWTACTDEHERRSFLDALAGIVHETDTRVVLAVRGDYFPLIAEHPALAELTRDATVLVGAPTRAEVRRMVEVPAAAAGLELEPGLAETVSDDAGEAAGLLPLLSTALLQLWERRDGRRLTYGSYVGMGGLVGAVAHVAEEAYAALDEADRPVARTVLLRLVGRASGGDVVRRRVPLTELDGLRGNAAEVVTALAGARLLTLDGDSVEVAHESLFREWPRLAGWIADDESSLAVQLRLATAAQQWDEQGRDGDLLWRGAGLQSALEVEAARPEELTDLERGFLAESEAALEAERREAEDRATHRERQNRVLRALLASATVLLLVAVIAGVAAVLSRRDAAEARDQEAAAAVAADARRLAAASLSETGLDLALLQAVEAVRTEPGPQTHGALLTLLSRTPDLMHLRRGETPFLRGAVSADGRLVVAAEYDPRVVALDAVTGEEVWKRGVPGDGHVWSIDGGEKGFLVSSEDDRGGARLQLWDERTGADVWTVEPPDLTGVVGADGDARPGDAVWDAAGRVVLLTSTHVVVLTAAGTPVRATPLKDSPSGYLEAWPDGRVSYEAGPDVGAVLHPDRPGRVTTHGFTIHSVSPDGSRVVTADRSEVGMARVVLRDAVTMRPVGEEMTVESFDGPVAWSADSQSFVLGAGQVLQQRDRNGRLLRELSGAHSGQVMAVLLAGPARDVVWAPGRDGLVSAWDLSGKRGLIGSVPLERGPHNGQADASGATGAGTLFASTTENTASLLDAGTGRARPLALPPGCECQVASTAMSPRGDLVVGSVTGFSAVVNADLKSGALVVWSATDGSLLHDVTLPWDAISAAVTPDGKRAVVNGWGGIAVVDLLTGTIVGPALDLPELQPSGTGRTVSVAADGNVAGVLRQGEVVLVDTTTGKLLGRQELGSASATAGDGTAIAWAGDNLVVAGLDGRLSFLDGVTLQALAPPREAAAGFVVDLVTVGDTLVSLGSDGDLRLWDVATWEPVGLGLTKENAWGFLSAGDGVVKAWFEGPTEGSPGRLRTLPLSPSVWRERACSLVSRELSKDEWSVIHPGKEWRPTCS
ncbi:winged helix-turn-helix domain-containing protein [Knoellia locipacati]|uniref:nSTAND1 domain-containing NTPase n=1 Tax=Knoellia locipacati TaxID=882824 RepID=UPI00384F569E